MKSDYCSCVVEGSIVSDNLPYMRPIEPYGMNGVVANRDCQLCGGTGRVIESDGCCLVPVFDCYAIRQISTGMYLPMRWKTSRGYSHDEPGYEFPRLFKSALSARRALSAWLQGEWNNESIGDDGWGGTECVPVLTKVEGRNADDFEIVQFRLERMS